MKKKEAQAQAMRLWYALVPEDRADRRPVAVPVGMWGGDYDRSDYRPALEYQGQTQFVDEKQVEL